LTDLDRYKNAIKKEVASFPEELWADMKKDHKSKNLQIDLRVVEICLEVCCKIDNIDRALELLAECKKMRRFDDDTTLSAYNALLSLCENRMNEQVAIDGNKDTTEINRVLGELTDAGLRPNDSTIDLLRRTLTDGVRF
jgi:hypothetical protein